MSHERIPEDPRENLARMESILAGYKRKLEHKQETRRYTQEKLDKLQLLIDAEEDEDSQEAKHRQVIRRKHCFELNSLDDSIEELRGKIIWAEKRQIPFIQSEIDLMESVQFEEELQESYEEV